LGVEVDQTAIPWITAVAAAVAAVAAAVSAWLSFYSNRTAADVAATNLVLKIREQYGSDTMLRDLRNLRAWQAIHGPNFAETWAVKLKRDDEDAREVDAARRRVSSFFGAIIDLHDAGLVPKRIEKLLTDFAGFDVLYGVVEPLERAFSPSYDKERFDKLRKLRGPSGLAEYLAIKPVIRKPDGEPARAE
jgi:hypothetical protein